MIICFLGGTKAFASVAKRLGECETIAVVFEKGANSELTRHIPENTVAVVSSEDEDTLCELSKRKIRTITCGGAKDTVTYSSNSDESIVVALQREINYTEPFELPLKKNGDSEYELMVYAAIKALKENGKE